MSIKLRKSGWPVIIAERVGLRVRLKRDYISDDLKIPAGTEGIVSAWWGGATVRCRACSECGVQPYATRLQEEDLELLPGQFDEDEEEGEL